MTNQEAIEILQEEHDWCLEPCYVLNAIEKAISALGSEPTGEPLTMEQMREMDGRPYWHVGMRDESEAPHWSILDPHIAKHIEDYGYGETWVAYEYPPAHIDREAWEPCEVCSEQDDPCYKDGCFKENAPQCEYRCDKYLAWRRNLRRVRLAKFCPKCGRPLTEEGWDMLEKRLRG